MCIIAVIIVLLPPAITTIEGITRGITRGITISLLFSIISPVAFDYLSVLLQLLLALLLLPLVLLLRRRPLQGEDLLLQVLVAPRRPLEEILDTIIVSTCPGAFSIELYKLFSHYSKSIMMGLFNFTVSFFISFSIGQGSKMGAFYPSLFYQLFGTVIRDSVRIYLELACAVSVGIGVGLSSPGQGFLY